MKVQTGICLLVLVGVSNAAAVTPVQKVIQLLEGMSAKGKKEKQGEQVQFAASKQFCDDVATEKTRVIEEETQAISNLGAKIGKANADAIRLQKEIGGLDEDVSVWTGDKKAATAVRKIEKADYDAMHKDYSESIDALTRAVAVMKKQAHDTKQGGSLAQMQSLKSLNLIPEKAKKAIDMFLQQGAVESAVTASAPEANGYEFQSAGIVDMLTKLQDKFVDERTNLEKEEANAKHAYNLMIQELTAQVAQANKDSGEKSTHRASRLQAKADASGSLKDEQSAKKADEKFLSDHKSSCAMQASDFEARQQLRSEEISTLEKTIGIMSSGAVTGNANKHLPGLWQKKGSALGQLRSNVITTQKDHIAKYLKQQAEKYNSRVLAVIAQKVEVDPFSKVKKMIKDLVLRLMEEANQEADHKGWCDTELSTNEQTRKEKTASVETLHAEIDLLGASISKLTDDLGGLSQQLSDLASGMAKATELRNGSKAKNTETIQDAMEAQAAVAQTLTVLKEFFAKAAEATSLVQQPYQGMQGENKGALGMLEVIASDFARLEADTKAAEATEQKEYDEFMTDSKVDKSAKSTDVDHKTAKKQDQTQALTEKKNDLAGTQKELDASLAYFDKLKPSCVDSGISYEDRVARRKEEIASLQESLRIMNGEDIA